MASYINVRGTRSHNCLIVLRGNSIRPFLARNSLHHRLHSLFVQRRHKTATCFTNCRWSIESDK